MKRFYTNVFVVSCVLIEAMSTLYEIRFRYAPWLASPLRLGQKDGCLETFVGYSSRKLFGDTRKHNKIEESMLSAFSKPLYIHSLLQRNKIFLSPSFNLVVLITTRASSKFIFLDRTCGFGYYGPRNHKLRALFRKWQKDCFHRALFSTIVRSLSVQSYHEIRILVSSDRNVFCY